MEVDELIDALEEEGARFASAVDSGGLESTVPSCPGWRTRELVAHLGGVHRWAAAQVRQAVPEMVGGGSETELLAQAPEDAELLGWFGHGHRDLVDVLREAPADLECWTFLEAPSPLSFWARRQAHETAIHRADAELAVDVAPAFAPRFACDGIDEILLGFATRRRLRGEAVAVLGLEATDSERAWRIHIGKEGVTVRSGSGPADCVLSGSSSDLYLFAWNRLAGDASTLSVTGDTSAVELWRETVRIRWT